MPISKEFIVGNRMLYSKDLSCGPRLRLIDDIAGCSCRFIMITTEDDVMVKTVYDSSGVNPVPEKYHSEEINNPDNNLKLSFLGGFIKINYRHK